MTRKKKKNVSANPTRKRAKTGSKALGSFRQLRYKKAFRIPPPMLYEELLDSIEKDSGSELKIGSESAKKVEIRELLLLVADLATGLWRIDKKTTVGDTGQTHDFMRSIRRHIESTLDALTTAKVEICDHTNEKYITGMALKVIAFQPTASVKIEKIAETIKPSVFYKDRLIQRGEVIVETPEMDMQKQKTEADKVKDIEDSDENDKHDKNGNT